MGSLRFIDTESHSMEVLELTSCTGREFRRLAPSLEAGFQAHFAEWRLDGWPRTAWAVPSDYRLVVYGVSH